MAEKRMFSRKVLETDKFYALDPKVVSLYVHLCLNADDDGFIDNVMSIASLCKADRKDIAKLISEKYLLQVSDHVFVIAHWHLNNQIQKDRFRPTIYEEEKSMLCRPNNIWQFREGIVWEDTPMDTEIRPDKKRKGKEEVKHKHGVYEHVLLTDDQYEKLVNQFPFDYQRRINDLDEYLQNNQKKHYDDHYLTIIKWARKDAEKPKQESFVEIAEDLNQPQWDIDL